MTEILPFDESHIEEAVLIERACFSKPWTEGMLSGLVKDEKQVAFAAMTDGKLSGYISFYYVAGEGYIQNVAVLPGFRRQGIGRALVMRAAGEALRLGLLFLTLEVRESNLKAIKLYTSCGFLKSGVRKGFYDAPKEDAVLMTRYFT